MKNLAISDELIDDFCAFLETRFGFEYPSDRRDFFLKKMETIRRLHGFKDLESCISSLYESRNTDKTIHLLITHLTIGETYFFRNQDMFVSLKHHVFPELFELHKKDQRLRIWSAGCSSGEEPYSIAILLYSMLPQIQKWNVKVIGTDINANFLKKAQEGCYKKWSFRGVSEETKEKYFKKDKTGESLCVLPEIKSLVEFSQLNLTEDAYPYKDIDLILCQNVLIYFSKKQIEQVTQKLVGALGDNGWLSTTAIEAPYVAHAQLHLRTFPNSIFYKKGKKPQPAPVVEKVREPVIAPKKQAPVFPKITPKPLEKKEAPPILTRDRGAEEKLYQDCLLLCEKKHYQEAAEKLDSHLRPFLEKPHELEKRMKEVILLVKIYSNQGDILQGLEWCEAALQIDKLNPILHYLHAMLYYSLGNPVVALKSLEKAIFIDHQFVMAYYMLGMIDMQEGNHPKAAKHFKNALHLLEKHSKEEVLQGSDGIKAHQLKEIIQGLSKLHE